MNCRHDGGDTQGESVAGYECGDSASHFRLSNMIKHLTMRKGTW